MRRLLGRIDAILASSMKTPLKLDPVTDKEIWAVEKKFQIDFPPGRPACSLVGHVVSHVACVLSGRVRWCVCGGACACGSEVRAFLKWNDGVPRDAPGMSKFVKCASLAEIYEAFFYKFGFARLMRW
jgi:hypothetical protein